MPKITPNLWFDGNAEEAARFVSFAIEDLADQAEVDRLWEALIADGGEPSQCGWLKDRFGLWWQIVPRELGEMLSSPDRDASRRAMEAMLEMSKIDIAALRRAFEGRDQAARPPSPVAGT